MNIFDRLEILVGSESLKKLNSAHICIFGLGGVGAAAAMDLVRSGIGKLTVFDFDIVQESNLNRLYFGYQQEIGRPKTDVFTEYAKNINPVITVVSHNVLLSSIETADRGLHDEPLNQQGFERLSARDIPLNCDYYLDCIDTLAPKIAVLSVLLTSKLRFASSMGTAGRLRPELLKIGSIWETKGCPLAQRVRSRLRKQGFLEPTKINKKQAPDRCADFPCVWSDEPPVKPRMPQSDYQNMPAHSPHNTSASIDTSGKIRGEQGSSAFVPQTAGHMLASLCVRSLL